MTHLIFDRQDFVNEGEKVKVDTFGAIMCTHGTAITQESMQELVFEALTVYGLVVRAQMLESVSRHLSTQPLTEAEIDKSINYLAKRVDGAAGRLGHLVELIEETKTPGPRH